MQNKFGQVRKSKSIPSNPDKPKSAPIVEPMKDTIELDEPQTIELDDVKPSAQTSVPKRTVPKQNTTTLSKAPKTFTSYSVPAVKELQKAIMNFADVASGTDITSLPGSKAPQQYGEQSREIPGEIGDTREEKTEYLGGSDPFGNFLIHNYIPKDSFTGKQYLNVDVLGNQQREQQSHQPMNLRGIIDSIKRIGTPGSVGTEKSVDGIWQTRTNNALNIIADLSSAMLKFTKDMGIKISGLTDEKLNEFKSEIPQSYTQLTSQEKIKDTAENLTPKINEITQFFSQLKSQVLENKNLREYIDQKKPFAIYKQPLKLPQRLDQNIILNDKLDFVKDKKSNWINLDELSDVKKFQSFINRALGYGIDEKNPELMNNILNRIENSLNEWQNTTNLPEQRK